MIKYPLWKGDVRMRVNILSVGFDALTLPQALDRALTLIRSPGFHTVITPNPEIVQLCRRDARMQDAVAKAGLVLPDGVGVVNAAKTLGRPLPQKIAGIDFAWALLPLLAEHGYSLYLLGAKPGVADKAAQTLVTSFPSLTIAGVHDGYFSDDDAVASEIAQSGAQVVFVCLGAPRQELWCRTHGAATGATLLAALGGSMDVWAGTVKRAPQFMITLGLEWLYRMLRYPKRLLRFFALPAFVLAVRRQARAQSGKL